ncbi:MAG: cobaltochelatase subunit CobN, partial [Candidatus Methanomethylophilaceae archaeon]|nr:cobaltochelatase subunit CobN [Candidatus Methanomethylophilaceae archaeon]
ALEGGYSKVKLGGDAQRNPEILPSGYNIVQFDPNAVPSDAAMARGAEAADGTIELYRREHNGEYPRSVAVVMWGLETSRTQGATVGQILRYLGFRRGRGGRDFASRFEPIPPEELGRPRIDVTVTICGFFRDMFSNIVTGLNALFARLDSMDEDDEVSNFARNTRENYSRLISEGYSEEDARDLSRCRLFGPGEGLYGTGGITDAVNSSSWKDEKDLSDIFVRNMGHAYSMRHRGLDVPGLMTMNHGRVDVVTQTRDMEERELIDLDHYYEFFGGLSKTVSLARGSGAAMYITDSAGPRLRTLDVRRSIEHGVRTRLLNPKWIDGMLRTDYHGAQHINDRFENVLGLAATTGAVDSGVFSDMEAVYIADKEMRDRLRKNNNWALMAMIDRLAEANSRGYWKATREELETLREAYDECEELAEDESDSDCDN